MAFKRLDITAYAADKPLDTFILKRTRNNTDAARQARGGGASWAPGVIDSVSFATLRPRICSYRQRVVLPFLWYKAPGVTAITVTVRQEAPSNVSAGAYEVRCTAFAMEAVQFGIQTLPPAAATADLGGAAAVANTALVVPVGGLPDGWLVIGVCWESGEEAAAPILGPSGTPSAVFTGYYTNYYMLKAGASTTLPGSTEAPTYAVQLLNKSPASGPRDSDEQPGQAFGRQVFYAEYLPAAGTDYRYKLFIYPPLGTGTGSDSVSSTVPQLHGANDGLYRVRLGYVDLHSISIHDSTIAPLPSAGAMHDAGQPAAAFALRAVVRESQREWLQRTRVHKIGPPPNTVNIDFTATGTVNRIANAIALTNAYQTIASCDIGRGQEFTQEGTNTTRSQTTVAALILWTHAANDLAERTFEVDVRLEVSDPYGITATVTLDDTRGVIFPYQSQASYTWVALGAPPLEGLLLGLLGGFRPAIQRHSLSGVYPADALGREGGRIQLLRMTIRDTAPADLRLLRLQLKAGDWSTRGLALSVEGQEVAYAPRATLMTWSVVTAPYTNDLPTPAQLGA